MATIGIRELRMDWLPSDSTYYVISRDASNNLMYDFSRLDAIILPLLRTGMRPVMCMNMDNVSALGITDNLPANMDDYAAAIRAFVQHYKDLGYTGLAWESHNEPEYFSTLTPEQTYYMYDVFAPAVKAVDPTAIVGGYGSGPDHLTYIGQFLDAYNGDATKPPMDYFSYHQYGSEDFSLVWDIESLFTSRGITPPPFYLTEWNDYPFVQTDNDTSAHASWVSKKMYWALMHAPRLARIHFFNYADGDTSKVFSGDNGLFTSNNHKKAAANAFNLYNNLHEAVLTPAISGTDTSTYDVYALATKDPASGALSLIIWNNRSTDVNVALDITNLPYQTAGQDFVLTKYVIDEDDGNYYYDYLYSGVTTSTRTVGDAENAGLSEMTLYSPAGSLSRSEYLPAWSVTAIKLDPVGRFDANADYEIINCNSGLLLQPNASLEAEQGVFTASAGQQWNLVDQGTGWYAILNKASGLALEVPGGSSTQGTRLATATWTGSDYQQWDLVDVGAYYKIVNKTSGMSINVSGESRDAGGWVIQWPFVKGLNEHWKIQPARTLPAQTLRAHWKLDETVGTLAADASGFDKHGVVENTAFETAGIAGRIAGALNLDGVDDHIAVAPLELYSNTVTLTAWLKCDTAVPWSGIFFNRTLNANGLNFGDSGELRYHWNHSMYSWDSGLIPPAGIWTFVALVIEPTQGTIYMDDGTGLQSATNVATHNVEGFAGTSYIGYDPAASTRHFDGCVDDMRIYRAALSSAQIAAIAAEGFDATPPAAPTSLTATVGTGSVSLDWADNSEPDLASYTVYRSTTSGSGYAPIATGVSHSAYVDNNVTSGTTYYYVVTAVDTSTNESAASNEASATPLADATPPAAPTGLAATAGDATVSLDWADNTEPDLASYNVYRSLTSGSGYAVIASGLTVSAYTDSSVTNDTTYYYVVTAVDTSSNESANSNEASATPQSGGSQTVYDHANADIPVQGTVSASFSSTIDSDNVYQSITEVRQGNPAKGFSSLEHKWTISVTGGDVVTFYVEAWQSASSDGDNFVFAYSTNDSTYTDMLTVSKTSDNNAAQSFVLPAGTSGTMYIRVTDTDSAAGSLAEDTLYVDRMYIESAGSGGGDTTPPAAPTGLAATAGDGSVSLDWANNPEPDLASYTVYRSTTSGSGYAVIASGLTSSAYTDDSVTNGTTYYYVVTAVDTSTNESAYSNEASAAPQGGTAAQMYVNDIAMSWRKAGPNYFGQATVWIKNDSAADVAGATVYGTWSGSVSGSASGITGTDGKIMIESPGIKGGGTFTFTVTDVVKSGVVYNSSLNVETSDSITVP